jgi:hypothetical protein
LPARVAARFARAQRRASLFARRARGRTRAISVPLRRRGRYPFTPDADGTPLWRVACVERAEAAPERRSRPQEQQPPRGGASTEGRREETACKQRKDFP